MNKTVSSFAMIRSNFKDGNDYIGSFVPLLILLFRDMNYISVDIEKICEDFSFTFGLHIPRFPMQTILNRMKGKYITKQEGEYYINRDLINQEASLINYQEEQRKYNWLIQDFITFCNDFETPLKINQNEAEELLLTFFKEHDLDMIFALNDKGETSLIPENTVSREIKKTYLLNRYINIQTTKNNDCANFLVDCAVGHFYASTILYREFANMKGKGFCKNCYLDTGIIFDLLGINGIFRKKSVEDLLTDLVKKGASLFIFKHHYENEIIQIIDDCVKWINNPLYDFTKASRALHFFRDNGKSEQDIQLFLATIPDTLSKYNIKIRNSPNPNDSIIDQIDVEALREIILNTYLQQGIYFNEEERESTIQADIKSISNIYKLRRGGSPTRINDVSHVFVTSNGGLAYATNRFEHEILEQTHFIIPPAITDTFLGTIMWIEKPTKTVEEFNRGKLIAYTNAVIQPNPILLQRFKQEVQIAQNNPINPISDENTTLLLETKISRDLLSDLTLGDPNAITHQTPYEVLEKIQATLVEKEHKKTQRESDRANNKELENQQLKTDLQKVMVFNKLQRDRNNSIINKISKIIRWAIVIFFGGLGAAIYYFDIFSSLNKGYLRILLYILQYGSYITGACVIGFGKKVEKSITKKLTTIFFVENNSNENIIHK